MSDSWRPQQDRLERIARHQLSMTPGAVHGRMAEASPVNQNRRDENGGGEEYEVIFSYAYAPTVGEESPPYYNRVANVDIGTLILSTKTSVSSSSTLALLKNGSQVASATLGGGAKSVESIIDGVTLDYGDLLSVKFTSVGANLSGVTVQVLLTD